MNLIHEYVSTTKIWQKNLRGFVIYKLYYMYLTLYSRCAEGDLLYCGYLFLYSSNFWLVWYY